jgi:hypothetical protein
MGIGFLLGQNEIVVANTIPHGSELWENVIPNGPIVGHSLHELPFKCPNETLKNS